jgi:hypothetical protein
MTTIYVKGQDVRVGDDLWSMGAPCRVIGIRPYVHPVVTRNEEWRVAEFAVGGRTLAYEHGYAAGYEITLVPGDDRTAGGSRVDPDDYLDPYLSAAAVLWARYEAEGKPGLWRAWVEALPPEDLPGPHSSGLTCFTGVKA